MGSLGVISDSALCEQMRKRGNNNPFYYENIDLDEMEIVFESPKNENECFVKSTCGTYNYVMTWKKKTEDIKAARPIKIILGLVECPFGCEDPTKREKFAKQSKLINGKMWYPKLEFKFFMQNAEYTVLPENGDEKSAYTVKITKEDAFKKSQFLLKLNKMISEEFLKKTIMGSHFKKFMDSYSNISGVPQNKISNVVYSQKAKTSFDNALVTRSVPKDTEDTKGKFPSAYDPLISREDHDYLLENYPGKAFRFVGLTRSDKELEMEYEENKSKFDRIMYKHSINTFDGSRKKKEYFKSEKLVKRSFISFLDIVIRDFNITFLGASGNVMTIEQALANHFFKVKSYINENMIFAFKPKKSMNSPLSIYEEVSSELINDIQKETAKTSVKNFFEGKNTSNEFDEEKDKELKKMNEEDDDPMSFVSDFVPPIDNSNFQEKKTPAKSSALKAATRNRKATFDPNNIN